MNIYRKILLVIASLIVFASSAFANNSVVQSIAFGSCARQMQDAPIMNTIVEANPDVFLMIGDVAYPDINDEATALLDPWPSKNSVQRMKSVYAQVSEKPEFKNLMNSIPVMAVWDDHDYGINDGDSSFVYKDMSQQLFLDFFGEPKDSLRRKSPGIYDSKIIGPKGKRVQIILLDTRYFRSTPTLDTRSDEEKKKLNVAGRYSPSSNDMGTVLGETQWNWLEQQLIKPAEIRLIVSSYPLIPTELGRDAWGNFPLERTRLFDLIKTTKANGVLILSGDVHFSEISRTNEGPYPLTEFTSSPMAAPSTGNENFKNSYRISEFYAQDSFGLIEIDWNAVPVDITLKVMDVSGKSVFEHRLDLEDLVTR
jgi:alkaline phosphatase D